jgi:hypothetical protein
MGHKFIKLSLLVGTATTSVRIQRDTGELVNCALNMIISKLHEPWAILAGYFGLVIDETEINSVPLVRKRTIPTVRPPLVGKVSANFADRRMSRGQLGGCARLLISVF